MLVMYMCTYIRIAIRKLCCLCHTYTGSTAGALAQITSTTVSTMNSTVTNTSAIYQSSNTQSDSVRLSQLSNCKQGT